MEEIWRNKRSPDRIEEGYRNIDQKNKIAS
jgi:hypothetical protein